MKGDFTRSTFDPRNHYSSVRMQQGRVQLDADWNEQADLTRHRIETEARDLIGACGAPLGADGFRLVESVANLTAEEAARPGNASPPAPAAGDFLITAGRLYVAGRLVQNERIARYRRQPYLPDPGAAPAGTYLAYLDVWERHLTALEEPRLREVALGGPDTATRTQTVWQVKLLDIGSDVPAGGATCLSELAGWTALTSPPDGQIAARAEESAAAADPCIVTPGAGYRALENRLYRVEVHTGGARNDALFKWSRDNGTVAARWTGETPVDATQKRIGVSTLGRDAVLRFVPGCWVELTDDTHELAGRPGTLVRVLRAEGTELTLDLTTAIGSETALAAFPQHPRVLRWDEVIVNPTNTNWHTLEEGVQVRFYAGTYRTGDYWLIPARTATADIEWPVDDAGNAMRLSPHGIAHDYCRLGIAAFDGTTWTGLTDCRSLFPPATELTSLFYVSGDGQEATVRADGEGATLDHPLQVGVANGRWPVPGARVRFRVEQGGGQVNGAATVVVATGADGIAGVQWTLGAANVLQRVQATLLDVADAPLHLPIRFTARYREGGIDEPGFHVVRIQAGDAPLENDAPVSADRLARGIEVTCDTPFIGLDAFGPRKPVCFVTLYLPWPLQGEERDFWSAGSPVATHPIRLNATAAADDDAIFWNPEKDTGDWLRQRLFDVLEKAGHRAPVLGYLSLKGDFIWDGENNERYLDGEVLGRARTDGSTEAVLPSGNRRRGGDLEIWFHLVRSEGTPDIRVRPGLLSFGIVPVGGSAVETFSVVNVGNGPLVVHALRSNVAAFEMMDAVPFTVEPGGVQPVRVRFRPSQAATVSGRLFVDSNDTDVAEEETTVALFAEGVAQPRPRRRARVQAIHNATVGAVRVLFDDTPLVENLSLGEGTPFFDVPAGESRLRALDAQTGALVAQTTATFAAGQGYGLVLCGRGDNTQLVLLENARENAADAARVDVRPFNGIESPPTSMLLRELDRSFALARCAGAEDYGTIAARTLRVNLVGADGQPLGEFDFDLRGQQAGRAFTLLSFSLQVSDNSRPIVYGIDGEGQRLMPRQLTSEPPIVTRGTEAPTGGTRVGGTAAANRLETTAVPGIGEALASRLGESGIRNAGQLMALDADRLGTILGINADRAAAIIRDARRLREGER